MAKLSVVTYTDCENVAISSYPKWELAFRVFSEVFTREYPHRSGQLLQYNHVIHSASQSFVWDNVYTYDIDFRIHISNHPERSLAMILQQAWSFRLKDRITNFRGQDNVVEGPYRTNNWKVCFRFNKGKCPFGNKCKFDHRCEICNKFGHGAFSCRKAILLQPQRENDKEMGE